MLDRFRLLIVLVFFIGLCSTTLNAQLPRPLNDTSLQAEAKELVNSFFVYGMSLSEIHPDSIGNYAIDWFAGYLEKRAGERFWPLPHRYQVDDVYAIRENDSLLIVTSRAWPDSVPLFGLLTVDWIWFLRKNEEYQWRIYSVRRTQGIHKAMEALRYIDTSSEYPNSLRPEIAYEESTIMLCNEQIRNQFPELRPHLEELVDLLDANDSIRFLGRNGERINQFNAYYLDWGMASHSIPDEVINEYMAAASEDERKQMEALLRAAKKQRHKGIEKLRAWEREAKLPQTTLDELTYLMQQGRIRFINTVLPWDQAVLLTMAGELDVAIGFIYSPHGEIPLISPEEYFYIEALADGWWMFRSSG